MSKERFAQMPQSIWRKAATARLSGRAWALLVTLWGYADVNTGKAFPGLATLSVETGIEARDIPRVTGELVRAALVTKVVRGATVHGRKVNLYTLATTVEITDGESADGESADGKSACPTTVQNAGESYQLSDHHPSEADASSGIAPTGSKRSRKRPVSENWRPDECDRSYAARHGLGHAQINRQAEIFVNWHRINGKPVADVRAAWRNWILRAEERARSNVTAFPSNRTERHRSKILERDAQLQFEGRAGR